MGGVPEAHAPRSAPGSGNEPMGGAPEAGPGFWASLAVDCAVAILGLHANDAAAVPLSQVRALSHVTVLLSCSNPIPLLQCSQGVLSSYSASSACCYVAAAIACTRICCGVPQACLISTLHECLAVHGLCRRPRSSSGAVVISGAEGAGVEAAGGGEGTGPDAAGLVAGGRAGVEGGGGVGGGGAAASVAKTQGDSTQGCFLEVSLKFLSRLRNQTALSDARTSGAAAAQPAPEARLPGHATGSASEIEVLSQDSTGEASPEAILRECVNRASGQSLFCLYGLHLPVPDHGTPEVHQDSPLAQEEAMQGQAGAGKQGKGSLGLALRLGTREKAAHLFDYILPYATSCSVSTCFMLML